MLERRLPTRFIAQLTLVLLLICNLTLCISTTMFDSDAVVSTCHSQGDEGGEELDCFISTGLAGALAQLAAGLPWLLLPLVFFVTTLSLPLWGGAISRWRFSRERGSPPPSWPRLHLEFCVLRN